MTPRYVPNDRSITRAQARRAAEAAGPDTSKPLDEPGDGKPGTHTTSSGAPLPANRPRAA